ncbi:fimbrillin family protein [Bacteroides cellulosilyticus]
MNRKMKKLSISLCMACLTGIMAAGCTEETDSDKHLPDGKYPMTFTAAVDGLTVTRAGTADGEWATTDRIAVQVSNAESGNEIKIYAPSDNGNKPTLTSDDPFYWQSSNETKTVSAWYCGDGSTALGQANAEKVPASWSVQPDQNEGEGNDYQESDFLYAAPKDISFSSTNKSLAFTHQTARVVINIKKAEAATETSSITKVTIGYDNNLALSGTYSVPTEGKATGTWNTSGGTKGTITPKDITASGSSDILKTYAALVIPQNMSEQKFIAVTLTDNNTYYYTPHNADANLKSGTQYTYNITVKHGYLEVVTVKTDGVWGDGEETTNVTSKILKKGFTADDLKIGDYYYSDGTTSDGGYRKYTDDTTDILDIKPVLTNPNTGEERTCIGIVYWVGDPTKPLRGRTDPNLLGDETLAKHHPNCTNGLVVSLDEVTCTWQASHTLVQEWLNSNHSGKFLPVQSGYGASDPLNNIQGYNNTKAIEAFNVANSSSQVDVVQKVVEYRKRVLAPVASSGWYVPSAKELTLLCGEDVDNIWNNNSGGTNRELINSKLALIGGATTLSSSRYWSSADSGLNNAFTVRFGDGRVSDDSKYDSSVRVRFSFAF